MTQYLKGSVALIAIKSFDRNFKKKTILSHDKNAFFFGQFFEKKSLEKIIIIIINKLRRR